MRFAAGLTIYRFLANRADPFAAARLANKVRRGQEPSVRQGERLGRTDIARPDGALVWLHTSGAHTARNIQDIISRMGVERDDAHFLVTTSSASPEDKITPYLAPRTIHQYAPYESGPAIRRFLDHWKPDVAFWVGSELWPALISETAQAEVPMYVIDGRMSAEAHYRWRWLPATAAELFDKFRKILVADQMTSLFMRRLGGDPQRITTTGPVDEGSAVLPCSEGERDWFSSLLAGRPVWLAAHTTQTEEDAVISAHQRASRHAHRLLLILVPDDITRGPALAEQLQGAGWKTGLRSDGDEPANDTQIYIADTEEEMGLWYRIAPITYLGRSLGPDGGGVNPYGPAALGSAIVHGPNVADYPLFYARFEEASAIRRVTSEASLGDAVEDMLMPARAAEMAHAAWEVSSRGAAVTDQIIELMHDALDGVPS